MQYGIRQLKDGALSQAVHRASRGEEVVVTDHGRPVAKIVPYTTTDLPEVVSRLVASGRLELRAPIRKKIVRVTLSPGPKSGVDYVKDQRR